MSKRISPILLAAAGLVLVIIAIGIMAFDSGDDKTESDANSQSNSAISNVHTDEGIPYPEVARVSIADAKAQFDAGTAIFVDVRSAQEHEAAHIPEAVSLPSAELEARYQELPTDALIFLYCTWPNEESSARVASTLMNLGYENVQALRGGLRAWIDAGYPMAGTEFEEAE